MLKVIAYTDGSSFWKTRKGGCGAYIIYPDGKEVFIKRGYEDTTNNQMELMALLLTLRSLPVDEAIDLTVYSDSEYVVKSFTEDRLTNWLERDFIGVTNSDLWLKILGELQERPEMLFQIVHIYGHQKIEDDHSLGNAVADNLADYKSHDHYYPIWE